MAAGDLLVAQELGLLAVDDGIDLGGAELAEMPLALAHCQLWVVLPPALLVLGEGLVQLGGDDRLVCLLEVDVDLLVLLLLRRDVKCILPDVPRHLLALLELLEAQLVVLKLGADRQILERFGVEEGLGPLVIVLFLVEKVCQRLLDVSADLDNFDLVGSVDTHLLDPRPDLILVRCWVV